MRNDIKDIVQAAYDERLLVSCITNARIPGTNIKKYKDLLQSMFNVQISCNGIGKSYEEEYGTNNWMQASKCIRNVIKATKRNILSFVITEKNFLDIPKFFEFAKSIKPNIIKFGSKCWSGRSVNKKKLDYYRVILPKSKQFIEEGRKKYPQLNIQSQIDLGEETPLWEEYLH
jgi:hypothetical protein